MKQSNVVKCLALVSALSMPLAAFAAGPGTERSGHGRSRHGSGWNGRRQHGRSGCGNCRHGRHERRPRHRHRHRQLDQSGGSRRAPAADATRQAHRHQVGELG